VLGTWDCRAGLWYPLSGSLAEFSGADARVTAPWCQMDRAHSGPQACLLEFGTVLELSVISAFVSPIDSSMFSIPSVLWTQRDLLPIGLWFIVPELWSITPFPGRLKVSTPKCDTCFGLVNWGGGGNMSWLASIRGIKWNWFCNFWRLYEYPTSFQSEGGRHTYSRH
jgi:hypothetical protein